MSSLWVFIESLSAAHAYSLSVEETRHVQTRRLRIGDPLTVFDAKGRIGRAQIAALGRKAATVEVEAVESAPRPEADFTLATAIPKGDRLSTLLQMWTQLGLATWQPLVCEDSTVRTLDIESPRLRRILVEGCKVARRPWAMQVLTPRSVEDDLADVGEGTRLYLADRGGQPGGVEAGATRVYVGPEAGFSERELESLRHAGARAIALAAYNLRIETAGVAAMAAANLARRAATRGSPTAESSTPDRR